MNRELLIWTIQSRVMLVLLNRGQTFDLFRSAEQFVTPDTRRRAASFFAQTLRSCGWVLIKAIYLIEGLLLHDATPFDERKG
jgi:hypothetical protein